MDLPRDGGLDDPVLGLDDLALPGAGLRLVAVGLDRAQHVTSFYQKWSRNNASFCQSPLPRIVRY